MLKPPPAPPTTDILLPPAEVAVRLVEARSSGGIVYVARDHVRAGAVAALVRGFAPDRMVIDYPASDALPGATAASAANIGARVSALHALARAGTSARPILILSVSATLDPVAAASAYDTAPPRLSVGDAIDPDAFRTMAEEIGYRDDDRVDEPGEYAVRGEVIDIYPVDAAAAVRVTMHDSAIAAICAYDAATQRSTDSLDAVAIGRAAEPTDDRTLTILDHLPNAAVALDAGVEDRRARLLAMAVEALKGRAPVIDADRWAAALADRKTIALAGDAVEPPPRFVERRDPLAAFARFARAALAEGSIVIAGVTRDLRFLRPRIARRLKCEIAEVADWREAAAAAPGSIATLAAPLDRGFVHGRVSVIAAADLLGGRAGRDDGGVMAAADAFAAADLAIGDVVVHERFGIGRVLGLEEIAGDDEGIVLEYAREGRRVVALSEADQLWRYGADADAVALDSLDGSSWEKRRTTIDAAIAQSARGLAEVATERAERTTDPVIPDVAAYERFAAAFPFTETPDQARAIAAIRDDLASGRPMDRLIVGDVGYGKTEVALRAAAMVAFAGRQVVVAAPTTVLVRQHLDSFRARFAGTGIEVAALSRLTSAAEARRIRAGLADGSIRVVVGTATVAAKSVRFADLALVAIDEEQRFGAAQKAKLAALGAGHTLLLSATPIPRTLQGALIGLQAVSIIATPPARRQPIRTVVETFDDRLVRTALLREDARGGQSFVVVPRIEDIAPLEERLRRLVPELGLVVAHGKLSAADLDEAMVGFAAGDGSILLATNIIEAGLDVPRANTMIVHRADRFGLAQLHQLRGRVGRGGRRGHILLTTEPGAEIAERTLRRLRTLQAFDRLGAGFAISAQDLDMRGAGDLLGEEQAGHMKLIGVDLYQHMLAQALRAARGEDVDAPRPDLSLGSTGHFPADWIPEESVRLGLYLRLVKLGTPAEIDGYEEELEDRFGALPAPAARLLEWTRVRLLARSAGVAAVNAGPAAIALTPVDRDADWSNVGLEHRNDRWIDTAAISDDDARLSHVRDLLESLHA